MRLTTGALSMLAVVVAALVVSNVLLWRKVSRRAEPIASMATPSEAAQVAKAHSPPLKHEAPELAPYMGQLQRLMHKLRLSIDAGHEELARFYLYETKELTEAICEEVPEYRGYPIALLIGRTLDPQLTGLEQALESKAPEALGKAYEAAVTACNDCHRATHHGFIRIPVRASGLPYLQDFEAAEDP